MLRKDEYSVKRFKIKLVYLDLSAYVSVSVCYGACLALEIQMMRLRN